MFFGCPEMPLLGLQSQQSPLPAAKRSIIAAAKAARGTTDKLVSFLA